MHSKSGNKIIEQINTLSEKEVFRAYLMAMKQNDDDLQNQIIRQIPLNKRGNVGRYVTLYEQKVILLTGLLVTKATMAIGFYNAFVAKTLGMDKVSEMMEQAFDFFLENKEEELEMLEQQLKDIDDEAGEVLKLDDFLQFETLDKLFEFWQFAKDYSMLDKQFDTTK